MVDLSRKVDMWKMPPILMVYLKRFVLSRGYVINRVNISSEIQMQHARVHIKVNDHVDFGFE